MTILDNHTLNPRPSVATIGFFDGVHLGHRHLISQVRAEAMRLGLSSLVVTFAEHPLKTIRPGWIPQLLTTTEEKVSLLEQTDIDSAALLCFDKAMQMMSAKEFMHDVLLNVYNVRVLLIGYDHHFGHNREEGFEDYVRYGKEMGIEVVQNSQFYLPESIAVSTQASEQRTEQAAASLTPSSTLARTSLLSGDVTTANSVLGYEYFIRGKVVEGFQNGRKLGYPTANLSADAEKLIPANGVYLVKVSGSINPGTDEGTSHYGMLNIGTRPTLDNGDVRSIEVNIFDFNQNIYEKEITLEFLRFIRYERKFNDLALLQAQLAEDESVCRSLIQSML